MVSIEKFRMLKRVVTMTLWNSILFRIWNFIEHVVPFETFPGGTVLLLLLLKLHLPLRSLLLHLERRRIDLEAP